MSSQHRKTVLIADCESGFATSGKAALEEHYAVRVAVSREEALKQARRGSLNVVIVGFLEPRGDSFRLHQELREDPATRGIPLLVVDVKPQEHSRKGWRAFEGTRMNAEGYLARPVEPSELLEEVGRLAEMAPAAQVDSQEVLQQIDMVLRRVERIEKALGSRTLGERAQGSSVRAAAQGASG